MHTLKISTWQRHLIQTIQNISVNTCWRTGSTYTTLVFQSVETVFCYRSVCDEPVSDPHLMHETCSAPLQHRNMVLAFRHAGERPFKCESCNYLAANQHEVTRHARQVHNGPKPLSCPYCDYKTADRSNFKKHVELHLNPRQFLCPLCKYAASKKCNLQYHIKSRHSGCNVPVDVSKVKLRIKKPGPEGAEENSRASKFDNSAAVEDKFHTDDGSDREDVDFSPINLSMRRNRPSVSQAVQSDALDKAQKKFSPSSDKQSKMKEKVEPEKKVITRQKRMDKEKTSVQETHVSASALNTDNKGKRRAKKLTKEKRRDQELAEGAQSQKDTMKTGNPPGPVEEAVADGGETPRPEKEKQKETNESGKENKSLNRPRKPGWKKTKSSKEGQQRAGSLKEKGVKRKAVEALDLSTKPTCGTKAKRLKGTAAEKLKAAPQDTSKMEASVAAPVKQKKSRTSSKKPSDPEDPAKMRVRSPSPPAAAQMDQTSATTRELGPAAPDNTGVSGGAASSPGQDRPAPVFLKPTSPPALTLPSQQTKAGDPEDDEGIHSSHEGGSDISDSASEGSDDSGLHSRSSKTANDPETPTDEIPTPTELKSHMCIFCDRTFPLEVQYRRHLNRHLVNVYYMDAAGHK